MLRLSVVLIAMVASATLILAADTPEKSKAAKQEPDGKYYDKDGSPTYNVQADGTVDWFAYAGYRLYHSDCHVCHGPDGEGSSYAPALVNSLKTMDYAKFQDVVVNGRTVTNAAQQSVMPPFGTNLNVMCHMDDLYIYLRARADGVVPRGRPPKKEAKNEVARKNDNECLGVKS